MPIIPDYKPVAGNLSPVAPSVAGAMAAGNAMADVGAGISNAGQAVGQEFQKRERELKQRERETDFAAEARASLALQKVLAEHEQFRETNDPATWENNMATGLARVRDAANKEAMSTEGRQKLNLEMDGWGIRYGMGAKTDALKFKRARDRTDIMKLYEARMDAKQFPEAESLLHKAEETGLFHPGELEPDRIEFGVRRKLAEEQEAEKVERDKIAADPDYGMTKFAQPKDSREASLRSYSASMKGQQQQEIQNTVQEGIIAGKITTEAEIDHEAEDGLPSVKAYLKSELAARYNSAEKLRRATPEFQNKTAGIISDGISSFDPDNVEQRLQLDGLINTLPAGVTKNYFREQLSKAIKGEPETSDDDALSVNLRLATSAFKNDFFGRMAQKQSLGSIVSSGFLSDQRANGNLVRAGLTQDEAKQVATATDDSGVVTPKAQRAKFAELWKESKAKDAPPFLKAAAGAIRDGHGNTYEVSYTDPSKNSTAIDLYGKVITDTIRWRKMNPDASVDDIRAHMLEIASPGAADAFIDSALDDASGLDGMVLPSLESDAELEIILPPLKN